MPSLWFCVPAHGRVELARICLRQLRRTCDQLTEHGIDATAVVIANDENLQTARELGFATYRQNNEYTSRKYNDGIQLACDPEFNPRPADYVVPCGSDDWVDWRLFRDLPPEDTMVGFQRMAFVREDGAELVVKHLNHEAGCGIRIYPAAMMAAADYRPADEYRKRGCDTSILWNLKQVGAVTYGHIDHRDIDPLQIVDWKSHGHQLNPYESLRRHRTELTRDPLEVLRGRYPDDALEEMSAHYGRVAVAA